MAQEKFSVTQRINLDGEIIVQTFGFFGEKTNLDSLLALMEGELSVKQVISVAGNAEALVARATSNLVGRISLAYVPDGGDSSIKYISTFDNTPLVFKSGSSDTEIEDILLQSQMLIAHPSEKPKSVKVGATSRRAPAATE